MLHCILAMLCETFHRMLRLIATRSQVLGAKCQPPTVSIERESVSTTRSNTWNHQFDQDHNISSKSYTCNNVRQNPIACGGTDSRPWHLDQFGVWRSYSNRGKLRKNYVVASCEIFEKTKKFRI